MSRDPARPSAGLFIEALAMMLAASLAIRLLPFARLGRELGATGVRPAATPLFIRQLRHALEAWSRRLPWRTMCFEQGVSAHWMLKRRGLASTLTFGARPRGDSILAHVWVESAGEPVVGCDNAADFVILSRFSTGSSS